MFALNITGCIEVSIMHPLDLVKTRFQVQSSTPVAGQHHYTSIAHCMKTMYHTEGVFSFWKGILPPLFVETPKRAWKVRFEIITTQRYREFKIGSQFTHIKYQLHYYIKHNVPITQFNTQMIYLHWQLAN